MKEDNLPDITCGTEPLPPRKSQLLPVLRIPEFVVFALSQAFSLFGDKLDYMALLAMIAYYATKFGWESARAISYLSVVVALPTVLFGPLAGVLVDRWDRRKVMIVCDSFRTVLVLLIPLLAIATNQLLLVYFLAFLVFLFGLFFNTARLAIIPNLVGPERVLGANSVLNIIGRLATFAGMVLGGLIVDWNGWARLGIRPVWTAGFYLDSFTYFVSVVSLLFIFKRLASGKKYNSPHQPEVQLFIKEQSRMIESVKGLLRVVKGEPAVWFVYSSIVLMVILGAAVVVLYVPVIQSSRELGGVGLGTKGVGYVAAIGSIGLLLSSMGYGIIGHRLPKHKVILVCFLVMGAVVAGLAASKTFAPVAPLIFIAGLALSPVYIGMDTLLHEAVPEEVRGRIFSTRDWLLHLLFALAAFLIGQLTNFVSARRLLFGFGILVVFSCVVGFFVTRRKKIG
ncbi:MAG: MFS transporter [candidate division WOR-3 bacterium]|jgi:MFS family permease|nr:MFS transporter [candidate division WOR-3 bacterium]MCR4424228.1 MFS transporter [candidate division WOR-3 bacterium]MDH7519354.1 MFS transporter [bacterium]